MLIKHTKTQQKGLLNKLIYSVLFLYNYLFNYRINPSKSFDELVEIHTKKVYKYLNDSELKYYQYLIEDIESELMQKTSHNNCRDFQYICSLIYKFKNRLKLKYYTHSTIVIGCKRTNKLYKIHIHK